MTKCKNCNGTGQVPKEQGDEIMDIEAIRKRAEDEEGEFNELEEEQWENPDDDFESMLYPFCQSSCGPHCSDWGGDGLYMLEINAQADYDKFLRYKWWHDFKFNIASWLWSIRNKLFPAKPDPENGWDDLPF